MQATQYLGNHSFQLIDTKPIKPKADEVRIQVGFVGICGTDMHIYHGVMDQRVNPPATIGHEMSGTIVEIGDQVSEFKVGDRVVVRPLDWCGECAACQAGHTHICQNLKFMGIDSAGAFQNSWTVKARTLHKLPQNVSLQQGALIEPLAVACHDVARSRLKSGEKAVVIGGGPIGQLVALVAKAQGADVVISEVNEHRRQFAQQLGIKAINPQENDVAEYVENWTATAGVEVVFEVSGVQPAIDVMTQIAGRRARIVMVAIHSTAPKVDLFQFFWKELELLGARVYEAQDFEYAIELIRSGKIDVAPFISSVDKMADISQAFAALANNPAGMKALVDCQL